MGSDSNRRPLAYETTELPTALPRNVLKKGTALECQPLTMKLIALYHLNPVTISTLGKAKPNKIMKLHPTEDNTNIQSRFDLSSNISDTISTNQSEVLFSPCQSALI